MSAVAKPQPRWSRRKDARPEEIIAAGLEEFVEKGYALTRLEDVAARAGVSKGTLYLYFANKEELFKAVVRGSLIAPIDEARKLVQGYEGSMAELLALLIRRWWEVMGSSRIAGLPKLVCAEAKNFPEMASFYWQEVIEPSNRVIREVVERGMASGEFRRSDAAVTGFLVVAPMVFLTIWQNSFGALHPQAMDPAKFVEAHIAVLTRGLAQ